MASEADKYLSYIDQAKDSGGILQLDFSAIPKGVDKKTIALRLSAGLPEEHGNAIGDALKNNYAVRFNFQQIPMRPIEGPPKPAFEWSKLSPEEQEAINQYSQVTPTMRVVSSFLRPLLTGLEAPIKLFGVMGDSTFDWLMGRRPAPSAQETFNDVVLSPYETDDYRYKPSAIQRIGTWYITIPMLLEGKKVLGNFANYVQQGEVERMMRLADEFGPSGVGRRPLGTIDNLNKPNIQKIGPGQFEDINIDVREQLKNIRNASSALKQVSSRPPITPLAEPLTPEAQKELSGLKGIFTKLTNRLTPTFKQMQQVKQEAMPNVEKLAIDPMQTAERYGAMSDGVLVRRGVTSQEGLNNMFFEFANQTIPQDATGAIPDRARMAVRNMISGEITYFRVNQLRSGFDFVPYSSIMNAAHKSISDISLLQNEDAILRTMQKPGQGLVKAKVVGTAQWPGYEVPGPQPAPAPKVAPTASFVGWNPVDNHPIFRIADPDNITKRNGDVAGPDFLQKYNIPIPQYPAYEEWRKKLYGESEKPIQPVEAVKPAEQAKATPAGPSVVVPGTEQPTATFIGWQKGVSPGEEFPLFNIKDPKNVTQRDGITVSIKTLEELKIPVPQYPPFESVAPKEPEIWEMTRSQLIASPNYKKGDAQRHKKEVYQALASGKEVPQEVLGQYPDIEREYNSLIDAGFTNPVIAAMSPIQRRNALANKVEPGSVAVSGKTGKAILPRAVSTLRGWLIRNGRLSTKVMYDFVGKGSDEAKSLMNVMSNNGKDPIEIINTMQSENIFTPTGDSERSKIQSLIDVLLGKSNIPTNEAQGAETDKESEWRANEEAEKDELYWTSVVCPDEKKFFVALQDGSYVPVDGALANITNYEFLDLFTYLDKDQGGYFLAEGKSGKVLLGPYDSPQEATNDFEARMEGYHPEELKATLLNDVEHHGFAPRWIDRLEWETQQASIEEENKRKEAINAGTTPTDINTNAVEVAGGANKKVEGGATSQGKPAEGEGKVERPGTIETISSQKPEDFSKGEGLDETRKVVISRFYATLYNTLAVKHAGKLPADVEEELIFESRTILNTENVQENYTRQFRETIDALISKMVSDIHKNNPGKTAKEYQQLETDFIESAGRRLYSITSKLDQKERYSITPQFMEALTELLGAQAGDTVFCPQAGNGMLISALKDKGIHIIVTESDPVRAELLRLQGGITVYTGPIEDFQGEATRIILNGEITGADKTLMHVLNNARAGTRVVAVVPASLLNTESFMHEVHGSNMVKRVLKLPDSVFAHTPSIPAGLIVLDAGLPEDTLPQGERAPKKFRVPELVKSMDTSALEAYVLKRYDQNAPQEELNALEDIFEARVSELELGYSEEELNVSENSPGDFMYESLREMYYRYTHPNDRNGMDERGILDNMRSAVELGSRFTMKKNVTDEMLLAAAKDLYEWRRELIQRFRGTHKAFPNGLSFKTLMTTSRFALPSKNVGDIKPEEASNLDDIMNIVDKIEKPKPTDEQTKKEVVDVNLSAGAGKGKDTGAGKIQKPADNGLGPTISGKPGQPAPGVSPKESELGGPAGAGAGGSSAVGPTGVATGQPGEVSGVQPANEQGATAKPAEGAEENLVVGGPVRLADKYNARYKKVHEEGEWVEDLSQIVPSHTGMGSSVKFYTQVGHAPLKEVFENRNTAGRNAPKTGYRIAGMPKVLQDIWAGKDKEGNWLLNDPQLDGVFAMLHAMVQKGHGFILADNVGMGKTAEAIATLATLFAMGRIKRALYITDNDGNVESVLNEINRMFPGGCPFKRIVIGEDYPSLGVESNFKRIPKADNCLYITTIERATDAAANDVEEKPRAFFKDLGIDQLTFDECHKWRTNDDESPRRQAWNNLHETLPLGHTLYMSATPARDLSEYEYLYGLGLWADEHEFSEYLNKITHHQYAILQKGDFTSRTTSTPRTEEWIREMKQDGYYLSRELSMEGVDVIFKDVEIDTPFMDGFIDFMKRILTTADKYNKLDRHQGGQKKRGIKSGLQNAQKRMLIELRLTPCVAFAVDELEKGNKVAFMTSFRNQETKFITTAINGIAEIETDKRGNIIGPIDGAKEAKADFMKEWEDYKNHLTDIIPHIKEMILQQCKDRGIDIKDNEIAAFTGSTSGDERKQIASDFQWSRKKVLVGTDAAKTGNSFQDKAGNRVVVFDIDPPYSVTTFWQSFGRFIRQGQKTNPVIYLVNTNVGAEKKFLVAIATRLANLKASSSGIEGSVVGDTLEEYKLDGSYANSIARATYGSLSEKDKEYFTNRSLRDPKTNYPLRRAPLTFGVKNYFYDLSLMPIDVGRRLFNEYMGTYDLIVKQSKVAQDAKAAEKSGRIIHSIALTKDLELYEVKSATGEKFGVVMGMLFNYNNELENHDIDKFINFTTRDSILSGMRVPYTKIKSLAQDFGKDMMTGITKEEAFDFIMEGEHLPLIDDFEVYLKKDEEDDEGHKIIKIRRNAPIEKEIYPRLEKAGAEKGVYNWQIPAKREALEKFLQEFPLSTKITHKKIQGEDIAEAIYPEGMPFHVSGDYVSPQFKQDLTEYLEGVVTEDNKFTDNPEELAQVKEEFKIAMEMPELFEFVQELMKNPKTVKVLVRKLRKWRGLFGHVPGIRGSEQIKLDPEIFKNPYTFAKVFAHEIFHFCDALDEMNIKRGNLIGHIMGMKHYMKNVFGQLNNKVLVREMRKLSEVWKGYKPDEVDAGYLQYVRKPEELMADFGSCLLNDPETCKKYAPTAYDTFLNNMESRPDVKEQYLKLLEQISKSPEDRFTDHSLSFRDMMMKAKEATNEIIRRNRGMNVTLTKFLCEYLDKASAVIQHERKLKKQGVKLHPLRSPTLSLHELNYLNGKKGVLLHSYRKLELALLKELGWTRTDFGKYVFLRRVRDERVNMANPLGYFQFRADNGKAMYKEDHWVYSNFELKHQQTAEREIEQILHVLGSEKSLKLQQITEEWYGIMLKLLKQAHDVGLVSHEAYDDCKKNPSYATFQVLEYMSSYISPAVIHQVGTFKEIANPVASTVVKALYTMAAIEKEKAVANVLDMELKYFNDDKKIMLSKYSGWGIFKKFFPPVLPHYGQIFIHVNGVKVGYDVPEEIEWACENMDIGRNSGFVQTMSFLNSKYFRPVYVGLNMGFQSFNLWRDVTRSWKLTPGVPLNVILKHYPEALKHSITSIGENPSKIVLEMMQNGMLSTSFNDLFKSKPEVQDFAEYYYRQFDVQKDTSLSGAPITPRNIAYNMLEFLEDIGTVIERLPKINGYLNRQWANQYAHAMLSQQEMAEEVRMYSGSPDFLTKGTHYYVSNNLFMFSNAMAQGLYGDFHGGVLNQRTKRGYWTKTVVLNLLPKILMWLARIGVADAIYNKFHKKKDGDKPLQRMMSKISAYDLANYQIILLGEDANTGVVMYLRIPVDEGGRLAAGLLWNFLNLPENMKKTSDAWLSLMSYSAGQLPSVAPPAEILFNAIQMMAGQSPYDFFRGQEVLTPDELAAGGTYAWSKFGMWTLNKTGLNFVYKWKAGDSTFVKSFKAIPIMNRYICFSSSVPMEIQDAKAKQRKLRAIKILERKKRKVSAQNARTADQEMHFTNPLFDNKEEK